jgi:hypothetical protein
MTEERNPFPDFDGYLHWCSWMLSDGACARAQGPGLHALPPAKGGCMQPWTCALGHAALDRKQVSWDHKRRKEAHKRRKLTP